MISAAFGNIVEVWGECHAGAHDLVHHADQERAGTDSGVAYGDVTQQLVYLAGIFTDGGRRLGVMVAFRTRCNGGGVMGELVTLANPFCQLITR